MTLRTHLSMAVAAALAVLSSSPTIAGTTTVVIAEAQYVMADGDTLASAEEKVMQRAQRRAVEEAGLYLESTFYDWRRNRKDEPLGTPLWKSVRSPPPSPKQRFSNRVD